MGAVDPNEALKNLRDAIARMRGASTPDDYTSAAGDLADATEALDEWLSRGGFLPRAWERDHAGIRR